MITEKITKDVNQEFASLRRDLQIYLKPGFDVRQTRDSLQNHVPKEIIYKSKILLDTLMNYLMADARERIKSADIRLQNAFFDADFRKRVTERSGNKLALEPDMVKYTFDPRLKWGLIAAAGVVGITFVSGAIVTSVLPTDFVSATATAVQPTDFVSATATAVQTTDFVSATATAVQPAHFVVAGAGVALSALAFIIAYQMASPKARECIQTDIEQYLKVSQEQVLGWLRKIILAFENDFCSFCTDNGFSLERE
ncbi:MAG: hypothetical protein H3C47_06475 [Candidatus Cloacimonetes bacterium]|nr:hypothetical protein [Candidatus Cloacimonadota bacterium]